MTNTKTCFLCDPPGPMHMMTGGSWGCLNRHMTAAPPNPNVIPPIPARALRQLLQALGLPDATDAEGIFVGDDTPEVSASMAVARESSQQLARFPNYWATRPGYIQFGVSVEEKDLLLANGAVLKAGLGQP